MPKHTRAARKLRQNSTDVERTLWNALRTSGWPWKFRRQHPIGDAIVDFTCVSRKLVIELDGGQHVGDADTDRSAQLARYGYRTIRFWNHEVLRNLDGVMDAIRRELER